MPEARPETATRAELNQRQLQLLNRLISEISQSNRFWQRRLNAAGLGDAPLTSLDQLKALPLLTKGELVADQDDNPPFGTNLTYSLSRYSRLHQTSGTTGKPMRWLDTPESWNWLMECWEQIYRLVEIREDDVFAFPFSFGPFIGFWAAFEGAQRLGRLSLAMGGMSTESRLKMIEELKATVVCCTPTYALRMGDVAREQGINLAESAVRMLILAGEPGGAIPAIRQRIEQEWGARVIDHWGMTDIGSLGIETAASPGALTILETQCIAEIIHPETAEPVTPGEMGELVITNLGRLGQPVLRYRTGDLVREAVEPAPDGISLLRLEGGILGRTDDMVTIRGNNVFPSSLDAVLREHQGIAEYRTTVVTRKSMPHLKIEIEPVFAFAENPERAAQLVFEVERLIKNRLNFQAEIQLVESLPRFEMKARRFFRE